MSDIDDLEELEEVEEVEELEDINLESSEKAEMDLDGIASIGIWRESYSQSPIPSLIIDKDLKIAWFNSAFTETFGIYQNLIGLSLPQFYTGYISQNTLKEMIQHLNSKDAGFSWYGRVERKSRKQLSVITKLLIVPLFFNQANIPLPVAYGCVYNDISHEYRELLQNTFRSLLEAARLKDNDTGNHIERVNQYSKRLAEVLLKTDRYPQIDNEFIQNIGFLAAMHDVGKIGTPDDILNKAGRLEDWEWEVMKEHTINGAYILSTYPNSMAREIALRHHEWWNGAGYPHGLSNNFIPLSARIVTVADVYDALRMERAYKKPFPHKKAKAIIINEKGTHFDPFIVDQFAAVESDFADIFAALTD
ncbi:MAG: HD domain-containing protein [Spirochaetales bacterium]|nr:HD domain-containing protein [Spirochaetales bacterium]